MLYKFDRIISGMLFERGFWWEALWYLGNRRVNTKNPTIKPERWDDDEDDDGKDNDGEDDDDEDDNGNMTDHFINTNIFTGTLYAGNYDLYMYW